MNPRRHPTFVIVFGLLALLVAQDVYDLRILALERLQRDDAWKVATGALLVAFLGYQWVLAAAAHTERHAKQMLEIRADDNFPVG